MVNLYECLKEKNLNFNDDLIYSDNCKKKLKLLSEKWCQKIEKGKHNYLP